MARETPLRQFRGKSEVSIEHALHNAAQSAARYAAKNRLKYADREFEIVQSSIVLSNPHIKEFRVTIEG